MYCREIDAVTHSLLQQLLYSWNNHNPRMTTTKMFSHKVCNGRRNKTVILYCALLLIILLLAGSIKCFTL